MIEFQLTFAPFKHKKSPSWLKLADRVNMMIFIHEKHYLSTSKAIFMCSELKFDHRKFKFTDRVVNKTGIT